jgi:hypothetical protein
MRYRKRWEAGLRHGTDGLSHQSPNRPSMIIVNKPSANTKRCPSPVLSSFSFDYPLDFLVPCLLFKQPIYDSSESSRSTRSHEESNSARVRVLCDRQSRCNIVASLSSRTSKSLTAHSTQSSPTFTTYSTNEQIYSPNINNDESDLWRQVASESGSGLKMNQFGYSSFSLSSVQNPYSLR